MGVVTEGRPLQELTGYATWEELVRAQAPKLLRVAHRITRDRNQAENVVQEAFLRIYTHLETFEPRTFDGWAYRITMNLSLTALRQRRNDAVVTDPDVMLRHPAATPSPAEVAELEAFRSGPVPTVAELRHSRLFSPPLLDALETMPARRREAVLCRTLLEMSVPETSAALGGVPEVMVRKQVCLGLDQLLKVMEKVPTSDPLLGSLQRARASASEAAKTDAAKPHRRSTTVHAGTASRQQPIDAAPAARRRVEAPSRARMSA